MQYSEVIAKWAYATLLWGVSQWTFELVARCASLEVGTCTSRVYGWLGGSGWSAFGMISQGVVLLQCLERKITVWDFWRMLMVGILLGVSAHTYLGRNNKWRELELGEERLDDGTTAAIGCEGPNSTLVVPKSVGYVELDSGWVPSWDKAHIIKTRKTKGRKNKRIIEEWYTIAPIVRNGSFPGCEFSPPIYAVCAMRSNPTAQRCGFSPAEEPVIIRKLRVAPNAEDYFIREFPADPEYLYEWRSISEEENRAYIDELRKERKLHWMFAGLLWGVAGAVLPALCEGILKWRKARGSRTPPEEDEELEDRFLSNKAKPSWSYHAEPPHVSNSGYDPPVMGRVVDEPPGTMLENMRVEAPWPTGDWGPKTNHNVLQY